MYLDDSGLKLYSDYWVIILLKVPDNANLSTFFNNKFINRNLCANLYKTLNGGSILTGND